MTQANTPRPAWRDLADQALTQLRLRSASGTPAFPFAPLDTPEPGAARAGFGRMCKDFDPDEDFVVSGTTAFDRLAPLPAALAPYRMRPDPRHLQAVLRFAAALGSAETWAACLMPRHLTLVETGESWLIEPLDKIIEQGFAADLQVIRRSGQLGALAIHRLFLGHTARSREKDKIYASDLGQTIEAMAINPTPAIALTPNAALLDDDLRAMFDHHLTLPSLSRDILIAHLEESHPGTNPGDDDSFRNALPKDRVLAQQDILGLIRALRAPTAAGVAAKLPHKLPAKADAQPTPPPRVSPGPSLAALPIPADLKQMLTQVSEDLLAWKAGTLAWSEISRGALLVGPPGVGKTETGRALARSAEIAFVECSLSAGLGQDAHLGESLGRIQAQVDRAKAEAPSILFLDELDAVGDRATTRGSNSGYERRFITGLNEMLDGFEGREGVFVIGTANHPELIDRALVRAGRFDRVMRIDLPDRRALAQILRLHLGDALPGADLDRLATAAIGASGADVAAAIRAARGLARGRRETFAEAHLTEVIGAAHRQDPPDLIRRIAIHEAGHAIVASCLDHPAPVRIAFTADGAETTYAATANPGTRAARDGRLAAKMAGRAAELLMLGEIAEGSGGSAMSDLAQATVLALREELSFGLGATGAIWFDEMPNPAVWLARDPKLRARVEARLAQASSHARQILTPRRAIIERLAQALINTREVEGEALQALLAG